jgi:photosystem II stability/assembly factor-like uncharacterized protein
MPTADIMYYSTDGCQTITTKSLPDQANAVWFLNYNLGYIATQGGRVYKSTDGGDTWTIHGVAGSALYDMTFPPNSTTGWTCGYWGHVHQVTPSGVSPNITIPGISTTNLSSVTFPDSTHGWICGENVIAHYYDSTWHTDQTYSYGGWNVVYFLNDTLGWAVGSFMGGGFQSSGLMRTTDGINWLDQDNPAEQGMFAILFINENEGWAGSGSGIVLHTTDGGKNWIIDAEATAISIGKFISKIFYVPYRQVLYVLGNHGLLLKNSSITGITSKEGNDKNNLRIYPNPCKDYLTIHVNNERPVQGNITLTNLLGIKVKELTGTGLKQQLDIRDLPAGTYIINIKDRENCYSKKITVLK